MNIESKVSGHWTDDQLIHHIYGLHPDDGHLVACSDCRQRLESMQSARLKIDSAGEGDPNHLFLEAQRRTIYHRFSEPRPWWSQAPVKRWGSAVATLFVLGGGLFVYQDQHRRSLENQISDAQLAQEVSFMSQESESPATAPLQALFEQ
jgi:hypothetical protein